MFARRFDSQARQHWVNAYRRCNSTEQVFTRGWALQELIAPTSVQFFPRDQVLLGSKASLESLISAITTIPVEALRGTSSLSDFPPNERLRWAARRTTKKKEDKAYCLLGIFDVYFSPLYGESEHAFSRLQEAIGKRWSQLDHSLVAYCASGVPSRGNSRLERQSSSVLDRRQDLMNILEFDEMHARRSTIKDAQRTTCEWILDHPKYLAWSYPSASELRHHESFLWINGKPGAGKSTMMKFAFARAQKTQQEEDIVLAFFFDARGSELERTSVGMFRALLVQLLQEAPDLQQVLDEQTISSSLFELSTLQRLFTTAVAGLGKRRLRCFIDALDECDEEQMREMVRFFQEPEDTELGYKRHQQLSVCFASRHYPTIHITRGVRMIPEDEFGPSKDLEKFIRQRLKAGKGKSVQDTRLRIHEKANGVFMWAVLVIDILNKEYLRGSIFAVTRRLREIPAKLSDLFKDFYVGNV